MDSHSLEELPILFPELDAFAKLSNGECANGVYKMQVQGSCVLLNGEKKTIDEIREVFKDNRFIVQKRISQHKRISAIFPNAINTIRLVTVYNRNKKTVEPLCAILRVGTGNSHVDNTSAGGIAVGIDLGKGTLKKYGFFKPKYGGKVTKHPNSGVIFDNYKIPFVKEAVSMATSFHKNLYGIHSIGWDIAITPEGPCFIEGNDNWEISSPQVCNGGLMKQFKSLFY